MRKSTGLQRIYYAALFSVMGLRSAWRTEPSFRFELGLLCFFFPASFWVGQTLVEWCLLIAPLFLVLAAEMLNTALERLADHISMDDHALLGQAKDLGSAAVFLMMILTLIIWGALISQNWEVLLTSLSSRINP